MSLSRDEKKLLLEVLCEKQIQMIMNEPTNYASSKYKALEELKVKVNDEMLVIEQCKHCCCEDDGK